MIAFDANFLGLALASSLGTVVDPATKKEIDRPVERVNLLIDELDVKGERICIPMPSLTEFLVLAGASSAQYLEQIHKLPRFEIKPFTERAAIELAEAIRKALDSVPKNKRDDVRATWAKVNFDRQIVAIAKAAGCSAIYSTDSDVKKHAEKMKVSYVHLADLSLPPDPPRAPQGNLFESLSIPESLPPAPEQKQIREGPINLESATAPERKEQ